MNLIDQPIHNDRDTLDELRITNYSNELPNLAQVQAAYANYLAVNGSAHHLNALTTLPIAFTDKFRSLYESKRSCMSYIKDLRDEPLACCPSCGSFDVGTLDHVLPKDVFAEYAIFSKNLVPCCHGCNGKKGIIYRDALGGRVLHPYFDTFLRDRLIYTSISSRSGSFNRPFLNVVELNPTHRNSVEIRFHMNEIVKKTRILNRQIPIWKKIKNSPELFFNPIPRDPISLDHAIIRKIMDFDNEFESRNNWKSMLLYGLLQSNGAKVFLLNQW